jgi:hypothetical protein
MKEQRRRLGAKGSKTAIARPPERPPVASYGGIQLLMLPERVLFDVDASMLLGGLSPPDAIADLPTGSVKRIGSRLIRLWLRSWEF